MADAWDVMTTDRPYQAARSTGDALEECRRMCGSQFCPFVVDVLATAVRDPVGADERRVADRSPRG